jgi:sulfatase maturation enzyme AslB (radical SAM superfamily)
MDPGRARDARRLAYVRRSGPRRELDALLESLAPAQRKVLRSTLAAALARELREPPAPWAKMELVVGGECDLRCSYCFVRNKERLPPMSAAVATQATEWFLNQFPEPPRATGGAAADLEAPDDASIVFFGGEPLLRFRDAIRLVVDRVESFCRSARRRVWLSTTTNGLAMSEEMMAFFAEHGITYIVSLDGNRKSHDKHRRTRGGKGSFDLIYPKLKTMRRYQPWMGVRMTPTPQTVASLYDRPRLRRRDVVKACARGADSPVVQGGRALYPSEAQGPGRTDHRVRLNP